MADFQSTDRTEFRFVGFEMSPGAAELFDSMLTGNDTDIVLAIEKVVQDRMKLESVIPEGHFVSDHVRADGNFHVGVEFVAACRESGNI